jgi:hypothetical protein
MRNNGEIAQGFKEETWVKFNNCAGVTIDGMLVWTNKPNTITVGNAGLGQTK